MPLSRHLDTPSVSTLLTIGMTAYNDEKYLREALDSLLAQTYTDFILLISDDCSTDKTPDICREYAERDSRIVFVRHEKNGGSLANFKYVLSRIQTPFFISCAGHDRYHPQFIEKLLPLIQLEKVVLAYPRSQIINFDGSLGNIHNDDYTTTSFNEPIERYLYILNELNSCAIIQGIWKTKTIRNIYVKPVISNDRLMILHATLQGAFQQYPEILFFMRRNRPDENTEEMYQREIRAITGKKYQNFNAILQLKPAFIFENIKMILKDPVPLTFPDRLKLVWYSTKKWIMKYYLVPLYLKMKRWFSIKKSTSL